MSVLLVTGSSGLVGSACAAFFDERGWQVHGVDNNLRADFFGSDGDTSWNLHRLKASTRSYVHHSVDVRDRQAIPTIVSEIKPDLIAHCAAQPSHDLAARRPFDDFVVNAEGTLNVLEATRWHARDAVFCFLSTNKVYGDAPNDLPLKELATRWDYVRPEHYEGIDESMRIDGALHSLFGVSKAAADLLVQEYGRYFQMKTVCFRGGCLTGAGHSAAGLHGFLAYVVRCARIGRTYRIYGYLGKQVRDNLHSFDVCRAIEAFYEAPRPAEVYNLGGGRNNSVSVLEAIDQVQQRLGERLSTEYVPEPRLGDHICYISDTRKFRSHYPGWAVTKTLDQILDEMCAVRR